ncbi:hypothetical protein A6279_08445 [Bacillus wiedmannii]|nr:hypothetical protein A6278_11675 [Bacillus wiedmannii]OAK04492.1 hypothetical protein A6279_08445 [Bacillus wiedmannii]OAK33687.1 hypothetical protein A6286_16580 [Bacillus wiedmannii]
MTLTIKEKMLVTKINTDERLLNERMRTRRMNNQITKCTPSVRNVYAERLKIDVKQLQTV